MCNVQSDKFRPMFNSHYLHYPKSVSKPSCPKGAAAQSPGLPRRAAPKRSEGGGTSGYPGSRSFEIMNSNGVLPPSLCPDHSSLRDCLAATGCLRAEAAGSKSEGEHEQGELPKRSSSFPSEKRKGTPVCWRAEEARVASFPTRNSRGAHGR